MSLLPSSSLTSTGKRLVSFANSFARGTVKAPEGSPPNVRQASLPHPAGAPEVPPLSLAAAAAPNPIVPPVRLANIRRFGAIPCGIDRAAGTATSSEPLADFLWKPQSDLDGRLVVRFGARFGCQIASVRVLPADGSEPWIGRIVGRDQDGRTHVRFDRPGSRLPTASELEVELNDGRRLRRTVAHPPLELMVG